MGVLDRIKHAWSAFFEDVNNDDVRYPTITYQELGMGSYTNPDTLVINNYSGKTILGAIFNRFAIDCSSTKIVHARVDDEDRYVAKIDSGLNKCLTFKANKDQTAKAFIRDLVYSLMEEGVVAVVPIKTTKVPVNGNAFDVKAFKVARILTWYPDYVEVEVYNENTGHKVKMTLPKEIVSIIENPLFAILNEPYSVAKKLARKLALLDAVDEQSGSNKMDLIIQLPYAVKTDSQRTIVEKKQKELEQQLRKSKYGIGYIDGVDKVTQLNRPVENNIMKSVEYLTSMLFSQLGITQSILDGTADESTMINYQQRVIKPILDAICDALTTTFISETARTQGQRILYFNDAFKLVPISKLAEVADKFTRARILSANELRVICGFKPVDDPEADKLINPNLNQTEGEVVASTNNESKPQDSEENQNDDFADMLLSDLS